MPYLTKTRFKEALECPDRMFYYGKRNEYADKRTDDDFLQELAKTGIQVGELAKCYFPGGVEITSLNNQKALAETAKYLQAENIILYEAALSVGNLLVRVDILIKTEDSIELIEVKSKSFFVEDELYTKNGISGDWKAYVYDIAFQYYVASKVFPDAKLRGYLCLIDKNKICTVDGLYQKFRLRKVGNRYIVDVDHSIEVGEPILSKLELTDKIRQIIEGKEQLGDKILSFSAYVDLLATAAGKDELLNVTTGRHCKFCCYKTETTTNGGGLKSGFEECWTTKNGFTAEQFKMPTIFDVWKLHYTKVDEFLFSKRHFLKDLTVEDLLPKTKPKATSKRSLTSAERQWLQIERAVDPSIPSYIDKEGIKTEIGNLRFPLHFIDFEVAMNGIPYKKGLRPYHQFAFQFSHHMMHDDGRLVHQSQWLETQRGQDPNISFVRNLKEVLTADDGSILIYSPYENTILLHLHNVVSSSDEEDKSELLTFIESITWREGKKEGSLWKGDRAMVDMYDWVFNNYLSRDMKGSNSIKVVLPAIINDSQYVQQLFGSAIYGTDAMPSKNFEATCWVLKDENGNFINPYKLLPTVFGGLDREAIETLFDDEELANGGAAMCACNLMQFAEMTDVEREAIKSALYKYCELDTLAMVILYLGLKDLSSK